MPAAGERRAERGVLAAGLRGEPGLVRRDRRLAVAQLLPAVRDGLVAEQHGDHEAAVRARVADDDLGAALARPRRRPRRGARTRSAAARRRAASARTAATAAASSSGDSGSSGCAPVVGRPEPGARVLTRTSAPPSARGSDPALRPSGPSRQACTCPARAGELAEALEGDAGRGRLRLRRLGAGLREHRLGRLAQVLAADDPARPRDGGLQVRRRVHDVGRDLGEDLRLRAAALAAGGDDRVAGQHDRRAQRVRRPGAAGEHAGMAVLDAERAAAVVQDRRRCSARAARRRSAGRGSG